MGLGTMLVKEFMKIAAKLGCQFASVSLRIYLLYMQLTMQNYDVMAMVHELDGISAPINKGVDGEVMSSILYGFMSRIRWFSNIDKIIVVVRIWKILITVSTLVKSLLES